MTLPDFLVIGAMKAGTTPLWRYLREHPQVFMPTPKEIQFFSRNWAQGWDWYEKKFVPAGGARAVGEASPSYAQPVHFPEVPARIASRLPDARLIYLVRHPIERVASQYLHNLSHGFEHRSMEEAVLDNDSYLEIGSYATVVESFLEYFPREQLLILQSEALRSNRLDTLRRVFGFVGVDPGLEYEQMHREFYRAEQKPRFRKRIAVLSRVPSRPRRLAYSALVRLSPRSLERTYLSLADVSPSLREQLTEKFRPEVQRLRAYLEPSFDGWGIG